jgi:hypothetical protein
MDGDITVVYTLMTHRDREEGGDVLVRLGSLSVSLILGTFMYNSSAWMDGCIALGDGMGGVSCIYDGLHGYVNLSPHSSHNVFVLSRAVPPKHKNYFQSCC